MIIKFTKSLNSQWYDSIRNILPEINKLHRKSNNANVENFYKLVSNLVINKGKSKAISLLKSYRVALQQYVLRQTIVPIPYHKCDKESFPSAIWFLKPNRNDRRSIMYSLSVMRLIEEFRMEPSYDVSSITDPSTMNPEILYEIIRFIRTEPEVFQVLPSQLPGPTYVLSNKAGPNGPSTISSMKDLAALQQLEPELIYLLEERLERSNSRIEIGDYMYSVPYGENHIPGKLVFLSDKACKTRVVAIADWWTNVALSNLHNAFMTGLRRLNSDVTYRQDKIPDLIRDFGHELYSSDMTAFTDRFPIELEAAVVRLAYGAEESNEWKELVSNRYFYNKKVGKVRYEVGNPMGLLSSWPISTFTHHVVKAFCAHSVGIKYKDYKYLILGDDTLDTNKLVYEKYKQVISELGVSINSTKCTSSESGYAEFAKRIFGPEGELTGLPVHLLTGIKTKPEQLLELIRICRSRGYTDESLRPGVLALLSNFKNRKIIICILSLPDSITGVKPLFTENHIKLVRKFWLPSKKGGFDPCDVYDTYEDFINVIKQQDETTLSSLTRIARDRLFWETIESLDFSRSSERNTAAVELSDKHPLKDIIFQKSMDFIDTGSMIELDMDDESFTFDDYDYKIYNSWMKGNYRNLVNLPSLNTYRFYNKGHYVTKCKFDTYRLIVSLLSGDCNISLYRCEKVTDNYLFQLAMASNC